MRIFILSEKKIFKRFCKEFSQFSIVKSIQLLPVVFGKANQFFRLLAGNLKEINSLSVSSFAVVHKQEIFQSSQKASLIRLEKTKALFYFSS